MNADPAAPEAPRLASVNVVGARFIVPAVSATIWTIVAVSPSKAVIYFAKDPNRAEGRSMPTVQMAQWATDGRLRFVRRDKGGLPMPPVRKL